MENWDDETLEAAGTPDGPGELPEEGTRARSKPRLAKCWSGTLTGVDARAVEIEVCSARGNPQFAIVGLPDAAVKEAKDRVSTAIANAQFGKIESNVTVNLAPADVRKEGPLYDLPIAVSLLQAHGKIHCADLEDFALVGELALSGAVRRVRGALAIALEMRRIGRKGILVPYENAEEASVVEGIRVYPVRTLREATDFLEARLALEPVVTDFAECVSAATDAYADDFADVKGQESAKCAIETAVAGGHNLLMIGPPGSGKSMLAKCIPSILPPLTVEEALEVTRIRSAGGIAELAVQRPFRAPHHSTSPIALAGGGTHPQPGEVSLAHRGVLFLDELPEFSRSALEILRQPIEDGHIHVARANASYDYPSRFMLVAAMNPCPCGHFGDDGHECRCSTRRRHEYLNRVSGPLLDRIDIQISVPTVSLDDLSSGEPSKVTSAQMRARILRAREIQRRRFAGIPGVYCNADMRPRDVERFCRMDASLRDTVRIILERLGLSARAFTRVLKVARTKADMEGVADITRNHILAAAQLRTLDMAFWGEE